MIGRRKPFDDALSMDPRTAETLIKTLYPPESPVRKRFFYQQRLLQESGYNFIATTSYEDVLTYLNAGLEIDAIVIYQIVGFKRGFLSLPPEEKYLGVYEKEAREVSLDQILPEMLKIMERNGKFPKVVIMTPDMNDKALTHDKWALHRSVLEEFIIEKASRDPKGENLRYSTERELSKMISYINALFNRDGQYLNTGQIIRP